jgi:hypothetical protein
MRKGMIMSVIILMREEDILRWFNVRKKYFQLFPLQLCLFRFSLFFFLFHQRISCNYVVTIPFHSTPPVVGKDLMNESIKSALMRVGFKTVAVIWSDIVKRLLEGVRCRDRKKNKSFVFVIYLFYLVCLFSYVY